MSQTYTIRRDDRITIRGVSGQLVGLSLAARHDRQTAGAVSRSELHLEVERLRDEVILPRLRDHANHLEGVATFAGPTQEEADGAAASLRRLRHVLERIERRKWIEQQVAIILGERAGAAF